LLATQVARNANTKTYTAVFSVTELASSGAAQICAMGLGDATAATGVACTPFTFDTPPAGSIEGQLPAGALLTTDRVGTNRSALLGPTFNLLDRGGNVIATTPINVTGHFVLPNVQPGVYGGSVTGNLSQAVVVDTIQVYPGLAASARIHVPISSMRDPVTGGWCDLTLAHVASLSAKYTDNLPFMQGVLLQRPSDVIVQQSGGLLELGQQLKQSTREDFGTYIAGVSLPNEFTAQLQMISPTAIINGVQYHVYVNGENSPRLIGTSTAADPYRIAFNLQSLPAGQHTLYAAPIANGVRQCPTRKTITVIPNPVEGVTLNLPDRRTVTTPLALPSIAYFDPTLPGYRWSNRITLPPLPPFPTSPTTIPHIGNIQSFFIGTLDYQGYLDLRGVGRMTRFEPHVQVTLLGEKICDWHKDFGPQPLIIDPLRTGTLQITIPGGRACFTNFSRQTADDVLWSSIWDVLKVSLQLWIGFEGGTDLSASFTPFDKNHPFQADLTINGLPKLDATLSLDFLSVLSAGGDVRTSSAVSMHARALDTKKGIYVNACAALSAQIDLWANTIGHRFNLFNFEPFPPLDQCIRAKQAAATAPPRVMASPALAADPSGAQLMVSVEDAAPNAPDADPRIMARFWNTTTQTWGDQTPLSTSGYAVNDPAVGFYGNDGEALVAWSQNTIDPAAANGYGDNVNEILKHQDLFCARWTGSTWITSTRLTSDTLPDGRAAIAGDATGLTLAWIRDTDGDISTTLDSRIAVAEWLTATNNFGAMQLLDGNTPGALVTSNKPATAGYNFQISAARRYYTATHESRTALAWTVDADGDISTGADRRVAVAARINQVGNPGAWVALDPQPLPPSTSMPNIALRADQPALQLAFIAMPLNPDGVTTSFAGKAGEVWTADVNNLDTTPQVSARSLLDIDGTRVRGERPRLALSGDETLVVFRQFNSPADPISLDPQPLPPHEMGVLAVSRGVLQVNTTVPAPPVSLTDGAQQFWQPAAIIDPTSNRLRVTGVLRAGALAKPDRPTLPVGHPDRAAALNIQLLSPQADPIMSLDLPDTGDPMLRPSLALSRLHAAPGKQVIVTAQGRNLGRSTVNVKVSFYAGYAPTGTLVTEVNVGPIGFNAPFTATLSVARVSGPRPIYAVASSVDGDLDTSNNAATSDLGALPAPGIISVMPSVPFDKALDVQITPADADDVAGYRLLRSVGLTGTQQLAGETNNWLHIDQALMRGVNYCYTVQAYDSAGQLSPLSPRVCGELPLYTVYLPLVRR
jgi:hypothetical protein